MKGKATKEMIIVTPELTPGSFRYKMTLQDINDSTRKMVREVTGVKAGKTLTVDLRTFSPTHTVG